MKKFFIIGLTIMLITTIFTGCGSTPSDNDKITAGTTQAINYEQITPEQAKELMDTESGYVILDVRTEEEFNEGHIEGAILIPDYEITEKSEEILKDKDQLILVYCRSGRRSKLAAEELAKLGYTNVKEFGGIIDWPYDTVAD